MTYMLSRPSFLCNGSGKIVATARSARRVKPSRGETSRSRNCKQLLATQSKAEARRDPAAGDNANRTAHVATRHRVKRLQEFWLYVPLEVRAHSGMLPANSRVLRTSASIWHQKRQAQATAVGAEPYNGTGSVGSETSGTSITELPQTRICILTNDRH